MSDNFASNSNMTALMTAIGNKIKNAAHTIYNSADTALTKRSGLKFAGRMKVTDDSTNGQTVVDDSPDHIEWDVWCAMSDQQKAAVKEAVIDNAPGVDGGLTANLLTKLWENPNPNSDFANQNITSSISGSILNYKFFILTYKKASNDSMLKSMIIPLGSSNLEWEDASTSSVEIVKREVAFSATNGNVLIRNAVVYSSASQAAVNNSKVIPLTIYGLKDSINLKFSAIASDVSTSADHCMMSDGVTSVEDILDSRTRTIDLAPYLGSNFASPGPNIATFISDKVVAISINAIVSGVSMNNDPLFENLPFTFANLTVSYILPDPSQLGSYNDPSHSLIFTSGNALLCHHVAITTNSYGFIVARIV